MAPGRQQHQVGLDLLGGRVLGPTEPLADALYVRVDHDTLGFAESDPEHDVGRLASHARQPDEFGERLGDLAAVICHELFRKPDHALGLLPKHAELAEQLKAARLGMQKYKVALRELAK